MLKYSKLNLISYFLLCLFVISFLVFLNSTQPFVLTEILGDNERIGDKVGSLAFADEIISIILCPLWGTLSDKVGTRPVGVAGLFIISISLFFYTNGKNVYPDLLLLRILFAIGTSGCVSMIPAMLAEVSFDYNKGYEGVRQVEGEVEEQEDEEQQQQQVDSNEQSPLFQSSHRKASRNAKLSGMVGMITGIGAVLAVSVFLPLPTWLDKSNTHRKSSLQEAYHIVALVALFITILLFFGLHNNTTKSFKIWLGKNSLRDTDDISPSNPLLTINNALSYVETIQMGFWAAKDKQILLSYIGGFVARSATVALTLFVPLSVNIWFYKHKICKIGDIHDPLPDLKKGCHEAYVLAAILTGIANTMSLIFAPIWGILGDYIGQHYTLMISSVIGFVGCIGFAFIEKPNSPLSFVMACLLGAGQIGAIVLSMSMCTNVKREYNGAIAGVYSLSGGLGILLITKLGGHLSDIWEGTPFLILSSFYLILFIASFWSLPKHHYPARLQN